MIDDAIYNNSNEVNPINNMCKQNIDYIVIKHA